jgi:hypothetical protein
MPDTLTIENMYGNVYLDKGGLTAYDAISSDSYGVVGWYASTEPLGFSTSTNMMCCDTGWHVPTAVIEHHKPKPIERFCEWCGALWMPATFREGCCQACGGPRTS